MSSAGIAAFGRWARSGHVLVLAYHDIVPSGQDVAGDRSLHLSQEAFGQQLDELERTHDVVSISDAFSISSSTIHQPGKTRPRAVITFDDAYSGALTAGIEELRARGLPATVFVTPEFIGGGSFWWDVLADASTGLDPAIRTAALGKGRGLNASVLELATGSGQAQHELPMYARCASAGEIDAALHHEQLSLASHTWGHPNLMALSDGELRDELARPLEWLKQYQDRAVNMISYPYGLADRRVQQAARDAGYTAGFMIDGGWARRTPIDSFAIPRLNVPAGVSRSGFVLRASGVIQG